MSAAFWRRTAPNCCASSFVPGAAAEPHPAARVVGRGRVGQASCSPAARGLCHAYPATARTPPVVGCSSDALVRDVQRTALAEPALDPLRFVIAQRPHHLVVGID